MPKSFSDSGLLNSTSLVALTSRNPWKAVKRLDKSENIKLISKEQIHLAIPVFPLPAGGCSNRREEEEFYDLAFFFQTRPRRRSAYAISLFTSTHLHIQHSAHTFCTFFPPFSDTTPTPTYTTYTVPEPTNRVVAACRRPGTLHLFTADESFPWAKTLYSRLSPDSTRHLKVYWVYAPLQLYFLDWWW